MTPPTRLPALLLALALALPLAAQDSRPISSEKENWPPERTITMLRSLVERGFVPQLVLAWSGPEGAGSLGFGELTNGEPVDENTVFEIGSTTKVFTSLLLTLAVEEKALALDRAIGDLIGEDLAMPERTAEITLEELASHRSGLPRLPGNLVARDESRPYEHYDARLLAEEIMTGEAVGARGDYLYSNYGAGLLGWLLGRAAGTSYGELLNEKILEPLAMTSTAFEPASSWAARTAPGHNGQVPVPFWKMNALAAAGDLVSTARDVQVLLGAAMAADPSTAIGRALLEMERTRGATDGAMKVGLGWHIVEDGDLRLVWHNGGTGGFSSFMGFDRASGRSLTILSSSNAPNITGAGLNAFSLGIPSGLDDLPTPAARDWKELPAYEGRYRLPASLVIELRLKGDHLGAQVAGQSWYTLYPSEEKDVFFLAIAGARIRFLRSDEGEIVGLDWSMQGQTSQATKLEDLPPFVKLSADRLRKLEGRYELGEGLIFDVRADAGHLGIKLADQPRLDAYPVSETDFVYRVVDARLSFVLDETGRAKALRLHQNGMIQEAPRLP